MTLPSIQYWFPNRMGCTVDMKTLPEYASARTGQLRASIWQGEYLLMPQALSSTQAMTNRIHSPLREWSSKTEERSETHKLPNWGWRDSLVVTKVNCSCRRPEFGCSNSGRVAPNCIQFQFQWDPIPLSFTGTRNHVHKHMCIVRNQPTNQALPHHHYGSHGWGSSRKTVPKVSEISVQVKHITIFKYKNEYKLNHCSFFLTKTKLNRTKKRVKRIAVLTLNVSEVAVRVRAGAVLSAVHRIMAFGDGECQHIWWTAENLPAPKVTLSRDRCGTATAVTALGNGKVISGWHTMPTNISLWLQE